MTLRRVLSVILVLIIAVFLHSVGGAEARDGDVTILFTHDLHSHLLPSANETGEGEYGGYARLMTVINEQKALDPSAVLVDGGDFSMGSLFQTAYSTSAIELRMMGAMGYDVTTFGNHEYDYLQSGLKAMLNVAANCGDPAPSLLCANYWPPVEGEDGFDAEMWAALNNYGVKNYKIMERGGVYYVIFGIFGIDSDACAPNSGMILKDPITTAKETVAAAIAECHESFGADPIVICLSYSGTEDGKGEDYELASAVDGIDVIISGHTHTTLEEPIVVNDTVIASAGEYGRYLGVVKLDRDGKLKSYELIPVDETVEEDSSVAALVEDYKTSVEKDYLSKYGVTFDQVLANNPYVFDTVKEVSKTPHESPLCNIFSDAYKWAAEKITGKKVDVAITAAGVVRGSLPVGNVTVSDVFNAASLGVGTEGELLGIYLTGKDLKNAIELDASIQPLMPTAQLFMSGVEYSFNQYRMIFNKVDYAMFRNEDGSVTAIEDDKLYFVVAGITPVSTIEDMPTAMWRKTMGVMADGPFYCTREVLPYMLSKKCGKILMITTNCTVNGGGGSVGYPAAKSAAEGIVKTLVNAYADKGIRANIIQPAVIDTDLFRQRYDTDEKVAEYGKKQPVGHVGKPIDIANAAVFLCSDKAEYICGAILPVDGARTYYKK